MDWTENDSVVLAQYGLLRVCLGASVTAAWFKSESSWGKSQEQTVYSAALRKRDGPSVSRIISQEHLRKRTDAGELYHTYNITLRAPMVFQPLVLALVLNIGPSSPFLGHLKDDHFSWCQCKGTSHSCCSEGCVSGEEYDISGRLSGPSQSVKII